MKKEEKWDKFDSFWLPLIALVIFIVVIGTMMELKLAK